MQICQYCSEPFPSIVYINDVKKELYGRKYCLSCSPFGSGKGKLLQRIKGHENDILSNEQQQILNGHLLGDGSLTKPINGVNANFCITRVISDSDFLRWSYSHFENYMTPLGIREKYTFDKRTSKTYYSVYFRTKSLPIFTAYYNNWYPEGKKIVPKDLILTPLTIAVWLADDGSVLNPTPGSLNIKFSTNSFSYNETIFLQKQLISFYGPGINVYQESEKQQWTINITNTKTSKLLIRSIYDVFPPLSRKSEIWEKERIDLWDKNLPPNCPYCASDNVYRNGSTNKSKIQKYHCQDCNKQYLDSENYIRNGNLPTNLKTDITICSICQSTQTIKYGLYKGQQQYFCKRCKKVFK